MKPEPVMKIRMDYNKLFFKPGLSNKSRLLLFIVLSGTQIISCFIFIFNYEAVVISILSDLYLYGHLNEDFRTGKSKKKIKNSKLRLRKTVHNQLKAPHRIF